ncbi:DUF1905 domain-containing protein [Sphingomonas sp.]|uniref:DUF1905 domain-containing protein n=1 Tax=Sphingomonas sp. TaxID=28214 RepID=UPI00185C6356|nr:DUF1905 domain-containing protein [Sphingomonas sp.]MBA3510598.1 DUF1905 domain-containing protein [Sphingomonas sp.]
MITVTAPIWLWSGGQGSARKRTVPQTVRPGRWHFLTVPPGQSVEIRAHGLGESRRGFGSVRVEAMINGVTWRTSVFPQTSGGYILPIKADVRRRAAVSAGDGVTVELELI